MKTFTIASGTYDADTFRRVQIATVPTPAIRIDRIDYPACVALEQSAGHCVATNTGHHIVIKGESHCRKCGAR